MNAGIKLTWVQLIGVITRCGAAALSTAELSPRAYSGKQAAQRGRRYIKQCRVNLSRLSIDTAVFTLISSEPVKCSRYHSLDIL